MLYCGVSGDHTVITPLPCVTRAYTELILELLESYASHYSPALGAGITLPRSTSHWVEAC